MLSLVFEPGTWRMLRRRIRYSPDSLPRYKGSPKRICSTIVERCFNGTYLQVSNGHFKEFYCRDFGMCAQGLAATGNGEMLIKTLSYALDKFQKGNKITTTITSQGKLKDFFAPGIDSLPFLLRALRVAREHPDTKKDAIALKRKHEAFLQREIDAFSNWIDPATGLVKGGLKMSTMKDHYQRFSSCYANCMAGMLSLEARRLGFDDPLKNFDYTGIIIEFFFNGEYFEDDLCTSHVAGDANTFPFYCELIEDPQIFSSCLKAIKRDKLDDPLPLRYSRKEPTYGLMTPVFRFVAPNYEGNSIWCHLGLCFLYAVKRMRPDLLADYLEAYTLFISRHKNMLEVFGEDARPYKSHFYITDDAMSWAVMYSDLAS